MKPDAPAEIRGPFKPIASAVPGMHFCEHLPRLAAQAGDLAILRSVTFPNNDHPFMIYHTLTGRESRVPLGANTVLPPSRVRRSAHGLGRGEVQASRAGRARLRGDSRSARADDADAGLGRRPRGPAGRGVRSAGDQRRSARAAGGLQAARRAFGRAVSTSGSRCWPCSTAARRGRSRSQRLSDVSRLGLAADRLGRGRRHVLARSRAAEAARALWPAPLRAEPAVGPAAGRAGRVVRRRALQLHDQVRRLGHAPEELRGAARRTAAAVGPGAVGAARRSATSAACWTRRWW